MIEFAAKTHPGNREGENEDAIGWDVDQGIWVVADGMGGHAAGHVASEVAKDAILAFDAGTPLTDRLIAAHQAVVEAAEETSERSGMGTTAVMAKFGEGAAEIAWVGDSRAYLWRRQQLQQVTRDHSFLEVLREQNLLTEEQLRADPRSNLVTQTLGLGDPKPATTNVRLRHRDWILLCSDGLNDEVEDSQIAAILEQHSEPDPAVDALLNTALENGGNDNTSIIIVEFSGSVAQAKLAALLESKWLPLIIGAVLAVVFAILLAVFG